MGARSKARKRAVDVLFEADQRGVEPVTLLAQRIAEPGTEAALPQYAVEIVEGVVTRLARIDEVLASHSHGWTIERMPAVDRAVLRVGTWEVLFNDDVPDAVKQQRLERLNELQRLITADRYEQRLGRTVRALIDRVETVSATGRSSRAAEPRLSTPRGRCARGPCRGAGDRSRGGTRPPAYGGLLCGRALLSVVDAVGRSQGRRARYTGATPWRRPGWRRRSGASPRC